MCRVLDHVPVIGQAWHTGRRTLGDETCRTQRRPVGGKMKALVGMTETVDEMRLIEIRLGVYPMLIFEFIDRAPARDTQGPVDDFARAHVETAVLGADPLSQRADHFVIRATFARRCDDARPEVDVLLAAALIEIIVFEEHGGRQHDIGDACSLGHELFMHADEQILAGKAAMHGIQIRCDRHWIGVLDQHGRNRRAAG